MYTKWPALAEVCALRMFPDSIANNPRNS